MARPQLRISGLALTGLVLLLKAVAMSSKHSSLMHLADHLFMLVPSLATMASSRSMQTPTALLLPRWTPSMRWTRTYRLNLM
jgi:hypothetical protein